MASVALVAALSGVVACRDHLTAPIARPDPVVATAVHRMALNDGVERVAPALADAAHAAAITRSLSQLQDQLDAEQLPAALATIVRARGLVQAARAADTGRMTADLTVIELALDDVEESLLLARASRVIHQRK